METFARLIEALSWPAGSVRKARLMAEYLEHSASGDRMHAVALLSGRYPARLLHARELRLLAFRASGMPHWLFGEMEKAGGRGLEPWARLRPAAGRPAGKPLGFWLEGLEGARNAGAEVREAYVLSAWPVLTPAEKAVFNQLATGTFRSPVKPGELLLALERVTGLDRHTLARKLREDRDPPSTDFDVFFSGAGNSSHAGLPFEWVRWRPVAAHEVNMPESGWLAVPVPEGIRVQWAVQQGRAGMWTEGGMPLGDLLPFGSALPGGTVLDGILTARDLQALKRRLDRLHPRGTIRLPGLGFTALDLLVTAGEDVRQRPLAERRALLQALPIGAGEGPVSLPVAELLQDASGLSGRLGRVRSERAAGMLLRLPGGAYAPAADDWLFLRPEPYAIRCVLLYGEFSGSAFTRGAGEWTLGVRDGGGFVPIARVSGGLDASQMAEIRQFVVEHTVERFGPVRVVEPRLVFTLAFDGAVTSRRRKAGLELKRPRIIAWNRELNPADADDLDTLNRLL